MTDQSRLMHVVLSLDIGGAEMLVYEWMRGLDPRRYDSQVCCLRKVGELGDRLTGQGFRVHDLASPPGFKLSTIRDLRRVIVDNRIDIVHAHTYSPFVYGALARPRNVKLVYTEHGRLYPEIRRTKRRLVNPWLARRCHHIVTISEATRRAMEEYDALPAKRIEVIWNGVSLPEAGLIDPVSRDDLGLAPEARIVGMASRMVELKNFPMALRSCAEVFREFPDVYLVIAGDGPVRASVERQCKEMRIDHRVRLLGMRDDLDRLIPAFDIFALTSLTEGISVTLLQAMAHRVPVVVSAVGGNTEVVQNRENGLVVPSEDSGAMADALRELLSSEKLCHELGRKAEERVRKYFSFDAMLDRYTELYESRA